MKSLYFDNAITIVMQRISQWLPQHIKELFDRYKKHISTATQDVADLEAKGTGHLEKLEFKV